MTKEEAVALLKQMQISLARGTGKVSQAEALGLAISALEHEMDFDYQRAIEQLEHDILYEPTFNPDDGSM